MHSLGYPGNIGGGGTLKLCTSEGYSQSSSCGGSGGPWIRDYRTGNHVDSVVHGYDSTSCAGTFGITYNGCGLLMPTLGRCVVRRGVERKKAGTSSLLIAHPQTPQDSPRRRTCFNGDD